ncbi:hypothetical protein TNCV_3651651 [Trichonephila clavipes]|uniref:Endonuclease/exonuclease/phosphatase domain-containing protein n=1 Tax=Trichonephila clavipes TaxID=2585209 RepID=A0A8X6SG64_TRICX|nr:hypothetical protein TNCV_3651651 [Trichonephila clavipes]
MQQVFPHLPILNNLKNQIIKNNAKKELHALFEALIEYEDDYSRTSIGLSLCSWNANGILSKINEFKLFVEKYSPDIILVQETKLRPIHNIRIANYTCYRNDRVAEGHAHGGTLILIKSSINHFNPPTPQPQYSEATVVTINPPNFNHLTIISIYIPPSSDNRLFKLDFENLIQINSSCVNFDDFNAWSCSNNSTRGNHLKNFTDILDIEIAFPDTPDQIRAQLI